MKTKIKNNAAGLAKYSVVGAFAFIADFSIYILFIDLVGMGYFISSLIAFVIGVYVNYVLAKRFVFAYRIDIARRQEIFRVYLVSAIAAVIHQSSIFILIDVMFLDLYYSKIISSIIVLLWSFYSRKKFIYVRA